MARIGFLGVGHLAASLIGGLVRAGVPARDLLLSRRGQAEALSRRFGLACAPNNAALVDEAEVVILAVRPKDAVAALVGLPWRPGQILASACAGVPLAALSAAAAPARAARLMPLTAAEFGASPTTLFPDLPQVRALLDPLGPVVALDSEAAFDTAAVMAAAYGWAQVLIARSAEWAAARGLDPATARRLAGLTFVAAGRNVADRDAPVADLLRALATPGGITARGLAVLDGAGVADAWAAACEAAFGLLTGQVPETGKAPTSG